MGQLHLDAPRVAVSWGECIDKITILEIKAEKVRSPDAAANISRELSELNGALALLDPVPADLGDKRRELRAINEKLWVVEDDIRACEAAQTFDAHFIALARSVYQLNDERARIKRAINTLTRSGIVEEKLYVALAASAPARAG